MIHLFGYSNFLSLENISRLNYFAVALISSANVIGVSGFVFITGFFLCESGTQTNVKKIIAFVLQLNFISAAIFIVVWVLTGNFSLSYLVKSFFPILSQHYWYPFNYIVLLSASPFLNIVVRNTSKKELAGIILLLVLIMGVFLKINPFYTPNIFVGHSSHGFLWWGLLYLTAAYYRRYGVKHTTLCGVVLFCGSILLGFLLRIGETYIPAIGKFGLLEHDSVIGWSATASSFIMFHQIKQNSGKIVRQLMKYIVPSTFIVYLIQEHNMVRDILWRYVGISQYAQASLLKLLGVTMLVFAGIWTTAAMLYILYLLAKKIYINKLVMIFESAVRKIGYFLEYKFKI